MFLMIRKHQPWYTATITSIEVSTITSVAKASTITGQATAIHNQQYRPTSNTDETTNTTIDEFAIALGKSTTVSISNICISTTTKATTVKKTVTSKGVITI